MNAHEIPVLLGVVLPDLRAFGALVTELVHSPCVRTTASWQSFSTAGFNFTCPGL